MDLVVPAIVFGAVGTAGQRCTSTRRIIVQESIESELIERLISAYKQVEIGNPLDSSTLMGPLIDKGAVNEYLSALEKAKKEGAEILYGGNVIDRDGFFIEPAIVKAENHYKIVQEETFAPILYIMNYSDLDNAIKIHNSVPQGLSSSIFTNNFISAETFLSHKGSDCGIANVNIGTSGAEIGGAFGGEKETGGAVAAPIWGKFMQNAMNKRLPFSADLLYYAWFYSLNYGFNIIGNKFNLVIFITR